MKSEAAPVAWIMTVANMNCPLAVPKGTVVPRADCCPVVSTVIEPETPGVAVAVAVAVVVAVAVAVADAVAVSVAVAVGIGFRAGFAAQPGHDSHPVPRRDSGATRSNRQTANLGHREFIIDLLRLSSAESAVLPRDVRLPHLN